MVRKYKPREAPTLKYATWGDVLRFAEACQINTKHKNCTWYWWQSLGEFVDILTAIKRNRLAAQEARDAVIEDYKLACYKVKALEQRAA